MVMVKVVVWVGTSQEYQIAPTLCYDGIMTRFVNHGRNYWYSIVVLNVNVFFISVNKLNSWNVYNFKSNQIVLVTCAEYNLTCEMLTYKPLTNNAVQEIELRKY